MSVTGQLYDKNAGVRRVILISDPQLHPFSAGPNATQNYYCLASDMKGFQIQVDLQAFPPGVNINQIQQNQVWWVEKRTSKYRLYLYGGIYDPTTRQINSTKVLPFSTNPSYASLTGAGQTSISGSLTQNGPLTISGQISMNSNKITSLSNGSLSNDAAAFGQVPVSSNGYGITGNTGLTPTPSVSLSHVTGSAFSGSSMSSSLTVLSSLTIPSTGVWVVVSNIGVYNNTVVSAQTALTTLIGTSPSPPTGALIYGGQLIPAISAGTYRISAAATTVGTFFAATVLYVSGSAVSTVTADTGICSFYAFRIS